MNAAAKVAQVLLGLVFLAAGGQKLAGTDRMVDDFARFRYPQWFRLATGAVETSGALGLLVGLSRPPLVPIAGLPLVATMVGALGTHARMGDSGKIMARPAALLLLSVAVSARRLRRPGAALG